MSTHAMIAVERPDHLIDAIPVHFDGYVEGGVGETLYRFWNNPEDVLKLCAQRKEIRCFGNDFDDIEYFSDGNIRYLKTFKNMTADQWKNKCGNFDYNYYFFLPDGDIPGGWTVYDNDADDFDDVEMFLKD